MLSTSPAKSYKPPSPSSPAVPAPSEASAESEDTNSRQILSLLLNLVSRVARIEEAQLAFQRQMQEEMAATRDALLSEVSTVCDSWRHLASPPSDLVAKMPTSLHTQLSEIKQSIAGTNATLQYLTNRSRKFYTCFSTIPLELVAQIFSWLAPKKTLPFRRLCKCIHKLLASKHFAVMNMARFDFVLRFQDSDRTGYTDEFDEVLFRFPEPYPEVCAESYLMDWEDFSGLNLRRVSLPAAFALLNTLKSLDLSGVCLMGRILPDLCTGMLGLEELNLSDNYLEGGIPPEIGHMKRLKMVNFSNNQLEGRVAEELGICCTRLESLSLDMNKLRGPIPDSLYNLTQLTELFLNDNQLEGILSPVVGNLHKLECLQIAHNKLTGSFPAEIGKLEKLVQLNVSENEFVGTVPSGLRDLEYLEIADFRHNAAMTCAFESDNILI